MKERWSKRGPGESQLRAAVAAADESKDTDEVDYQAFMALEEEEARFAKFQIFKANRVSVQESEYVEGAYRGPPGEA